MTIHSLRTVLPHLSMAYRAQMRLDVKVKRFINGALRMIFATPITDRPTEERVRELIQECKIVPYWKVMRFTACPCCKCWSLGVQADGRIVRHTEGLGSVEKYKRWHGAVIKTSKLPICKGSGRKVGIYA